MAVPQSAQTSVTTTPIYYINCIVRNAQQHFFLLFLVDRLFTQRDACARGSGHLENEKRAAIKKSIRGTFADALWYTHYTL